MEFTINTFGFDFRQGHLGECDLFDHAVTLARAMPVAIVCELIGEN